MRVPVGLNIWSRLVEQSFPYLDKALAPFDSLWLPDHVQAVNFADAPRPEGTQLFSASVLPHLS